MPTPSTDRPSPHTQGPQAHCRPAGLFVVRALVGSPSIPRLTPTKAFRSSLENTGTLVNPASSIAPMAIVHWVGSLISLPALAPSVSVSFPVVAMGRAGQSTHRQRAERVGQSVRSSAVSCPFAWSNSVRVVAQAQSYRPHGTYRQVGLQHKFWHRGLPLFFSRLVPTLSRGIRMAVQSLWRRRCYGSSHGGEYDRDPLDFTSMKESVVWKVPGVSTRSRCRSHCPAGSASRPEPWHVFLWRRVVLHSAARRSGP